MDKKKEFLNLFPAEMRQLFEKVAGKIDFIREIRLRAEKVIVLYLENKEFFLLGNGEWSIEKEKALILKKNELENILNHICKYSLYAYENEFRQGYITIEGGHRIGVGGKIILEGQKVKTIKYISCMNIRVSHEILGSANTVLRYLYQSGILQNTLIISPPGGGKTTLLRDIVRQVSNGNQYAKGMNVGVVDERSEIGGSFMGIPQNDVGIRTDILDGCPKVEGMMMLIRSMAPNMIAIDELGSKEDVEALEQAIQCGCKVIATVHGNSLQEIKQKRYMDEIIKYRFFKRYILLDNGRNSGVIKDIYNEDFELC